MTLFVLFGLLILLSSAWVVLALWFQAPWGDWGRNLLIALWCLGALGMLCLLASGELRWSMAGYLLMACVFFVWWASLQPSHERDWADDLAHTTTGEVVGNRATLSNVRNFVWRSNEDYDIRWETRHYDLERLKSVDMITSEWGMPGIAHVLVSFGFEGGEFITFTVEIRREREESFSAVGGFFKQFELSVLATDERDAIRVRSNVRGEEVHLYRVHMPEQAMRELFVSYVTEANQLAAHARFYHTVTANCTIIVYNMVRQIIDGLPLDYRLLLSANLPAYVKQVGGLEDLPLQQLIDAGHINDRARAADHDPDFSKQIRRGVPGWE